MNHLPSHPPIQTTYIAYTNRGFLLHETTTTAELRLHGASVKDVRRRAAEDDLFQLSSRASRKTVAWAVLKRLENADLSLLALLAEGGLETKRLTTFYLILLEHPLLRDFMTEVVIDAVRRFARVVTTADVNAFINRKTEQVPAVSAWSEATLAKARSTLIALCDRAGLLKEDERALLIEPQLVPQALRDELERAGRREFLALLLDQGVM